MEVTFVPSLEESRPDKVAVLNVWGFMRPCFGFHHQDKMTTLNIDTQRISFAFFPRLTAAAARATLMLPAPVISAVDVTRAYLQNNATNSGAISCQGVLPHDGVTPGTTCSGLAVPPLPGPIGVVGDLGVDNDGKISQWRLELTGPTTAVMERSGSPAPLPGAADGTDGCEHFQVTYVVEYL